jgi:hypothetical protein
MIRIHDTTRTIPYYQPEPLTDLPLIYQREHLFPYTSYGDTATMSVPRAFRMVVLENDTLRVEVAPELGGRVYGLFDKRIGKEILFSNPVVKPVRILPIWGFISGGIEFNFPIAHSPTSIAEVGCRTGQTGDYGFIRVGEREARTGMEWVVELGLMADQPVLIQRSAFRNRTGADHPWMSWTICAVRSTEGTEFVHPPHRVLVHDDRVVEADWPGDGLQWDRNAQQMTALFWKPGSAPQFGAFHHDLGFGLMHLADPAQLPGKKVWTYGYGKHRHWGLGSTEGDLCYCEIESGPLLDQGEKPLFPQNTERRVEEYWVPVHSREACDKVPWPQLNLPPISDAWMGWEHSPWQSEWEKFRADEGPLPSSLVPTGINLESALCRELQRGNTNAAEALALWLTFHGRPEEALALADNPTRCLSRRCDQTGQKFIAEGELAPQPVALADSPTAHRLAGLILWKALHQPMDAIPRLEAGPLHDPIAVVELDELYAELGFTAKRVALLARAPHHRLVVERKAALALTTGDPAETIRLLTDTAWPREHQRYVRTELWKKAMSASGQTDPEVPAFLNEDNLARFGAYWSD